MQLHSSRGGCPAFALVAGLAGLAGCADGSDGQPADLESAAQLGTADAQVSVGGFVYAGTNDASENGVARYRRHADGRLELREITPTGGRGTGSKIVPSLTADGPDPLVSQHSVALNATHSILMVVNAGDGTVTSFRVGPSGVLTFASRVSSGGMFPNSIAIRGDVAYVANVGDPAGGVAARVTGFRIGLSGRLQRVTGDGTFADPNAEPANVVFSPDGTRLVVSDVATNHLDVFPIRRDGSLGTATVNDSAGVSPFGMAFAPNGTLLVTEAAAVVLGAASVSSYHLDGTRLVAVTPALANGQTAACWVSIGPDGRFAYATNTGDPGDISIYAIASSGELTLVEAAAVPRAAAPGLPTSGPVDSAISADGRYLYQAYSALGVVGAFRIGADGRLTPVAGGDAGGLPALGAEGLDGF